MADKNPSVHIPRELLLRVAEATYKVAQGKPGLLKYGINETYLTTFLADIEKAKAFKNDEALTNEMKGQTQEKNVQLDLCYEWLQTAEFIFHAIFKKEDPPFQEFPAKISRYAKNEAAMIDLLPNIFNLLTKYKTKLTNMQEDFIPNGEACLQNLTSQDTLQEAKKKEDKNYTAERHAAEVVVYNKVNKINEAGRKAYKKDPPTAKLFETPWPRTGSGDDGEEKPPEVPPPA